jgi:hypothetical protein
MAPAGDFTTDTDAESTGITDIVMVLLVAVEGTAQSREEVRMTRT